MLCVKNIDLRKMERIKTSMFNLSIEELEYIRDFTIKTLDKKWLQEYIKVQTDN